MAHSNQRYNFIIISVPTIAACATICAESIYGSEEGGDTCAYVGGGGTIWTA